MFNKVLIANRGAIAVRIIRTLKQMGIQSVAVYAEADKDSLHVLHADEAYSLGEGGATETYLNQQKLMALMQEQQIDAVHPGYGFLSENPQFVEFCEANNIAFIGPTADQMRSFGLKHTARDIAQKNHVPLLPGTDLLYSLEEAISAAAAIGYPVILKSTAGGGGIGMQMCQTEQQLQNSYASVKRLSANNFSNDGVFIEKYITRARHIEVQVFGDGNGVAVALGERDCSAQRRHQKVLEETPAPNLSDNLRQTLHETAQRLVAAVAYRNAGTVEFIFDDATQEFYFLEVNTRLQVEHGVTEQVYGVDLVEWMVRLAAGELEDLNQRAAQLSPQGHAIQARIYAENPFKDFQPCAGLLAVTQWPEQKAKTLRIDHWISPGLEVSARFDPLLAKMIAWAPSRNEAIAELSSALAETTLQGIETNKYYIEAVLQTEAFKHGTLHTRYLNDFRYDSHTIEVLSPGTQTTIQDYPGRVGYWDVGVPPSGPFDNYSFRLGNKIVGNSASAAGLEITLNGPKLQFNTATTIAIVGAPIDAQLDGVELSLWQRHNVEAGQVLTLGKITTAGARAYLMVAGGIEGNCYLDSQSTFTLGQFGGFSGRVLRTGDVLHLSATEQAFAGADNHSAPIAPGILPAIQNQWQLRVIYGPHGAPDFFTPDDIEMFFSQQWEVHYNSSRTGVRLIGPKPQWARASGGEAGMHPSNIHDNAYAIGTVDFTGDMPVILGPDGPSLGGFVCPATVISADLWKLGQLRAGDKIQFVPVTQASAKAIEQQQLAQIETLQQQPEFTPSVCPIAELNAIHSEQDDIVYRAAGDKYLLVEFGPQQLDIRLRFRVHALMLWLQEHIELDPQLDAIQELTPGIRSLQIHYDNLRLSLDSLVVILNGAHQELMSRETLEVSSRVVYLPLSWDDPACQLAVQKYEQSVRKNAPWCPSNIEFIRRINGLDSIQAVKDIVFNARYVVMGLGDVYLGAPVATPLDPRHRLVTTKYNPARTWTAENSVGIGGSYLCVYGMEGPGGYQFIGRTLQMWNRYRTTEAFSKPWLLRFFDQIRFYEVSAEEILDIRERFPRGDYPLRVEETRFNLDEYEQFLTDNQATIKDFTEQRNQAFETELQHWIDSGQFHYDSAQSDEDPQPLDDQLAENCFAVESHVAGNLWQWQVKEGDILAAGDTVCILESMKMEIEVTTPQAGQVIRLNRQQGQQVSAGQTLLIIEDIIDHTDGE